MAMQSLISHYSLVTPFDWKRWAWSDCDGNDLSQCHHSLVTPFDWKRQIGMSYEHCTIPRGHHSLVTPFDWKQVEQLLQPPKVPMRQSPLAGDTF